VEDDEAAQDEDQIWRAVGVNGDGALSAEEAIKLLEYVSRMLKGEQPDKPSILLPPTEVEHLSALSILCQGYLAAHAEGYDEPAGSEQEGGWRPEEISDALKQMGWTEDLLASAANGQPEKSHELSWWTSSFDDTDNLIENAEDEWGDAEGWPKVESLLQRIIDEEGKIEGKEDCATVANAYCELDERLRGKS